MPRAAANVYYRIVSPFVVYVDGVPYPYNDRSVIYTADHPVVKANRGSFEVVVPVGPVRKVEEATANPGESR
jgi:hypothetical protein